MAGKNTAAFGLYSNRVQVEQGIASLLAAGFRNEDISVLFPDNAGTKDFAHQKNTKAPEGATAGGGAGGAIGGTLGLLVGIGALAIPGLGPFIAAGPIMVALAGMGVGGAVGDVADNRIELRHRNGQTIGRTRVHHHDLAISLRHCEEPTGPARSGRPDGSQWRYL